MNTNQNIRSFKDLLIWQKSMNLMVEVYRLTKQFPPEEQFAMTSQTRRAVISIPSNISEGYGRNTRKEYANFLRISQGSLAELETLTTAAIRLSYCSEAECSRIVDGIAEIGRMLYAIRRKLNN